MSEILDFDDLRRVSRLGPRARLSRLERWASANGIRYKYDGNGGIWTTADAMNAAIGINPAASANAGGLYAVDEVF